jgi:hypothetical protein
MPIDYAALKSWPFPDVEHRYTARDTMLYALGLGCGGNPTDPDELQFVFEEGLHALPTMAVVLGGPFPDEIIRTEIWRDGETVSFRARALERDVVILNNGLAMIGDPEAGIRDQ